MIRAFTIVGYLGDTVTIDITNPWETGFYVNSVEGLGPSKATINTTLTATADGSIFNSSRVGERNIVFDLGFVQNNNGESVETIRQLCNRLFRIKQYVLIYILTDNRYVYTYGYIESNEPNIWSEWENAQISIICPDPFFYDVDINNQHHASLTHNSSAVFSFPFSNNSLSTNTIIFSTQNVDSTANIYYEGDIETGFDISINIREAAAGTVGDVLIFKTSHNEHLKIDDDKVNTFTGSKLKTGDVINVSTKTGQKHVTLIRNSTSTNILNCVDLNANWLTLDPGDNLIGCNTEFDAQDVDVTISYDVLYTGV